MQKCDFDIEFIIANDKSTDETNQAINEIIDQTTIPDHLKMRYYDHPNNKGMHYKKYSNFKLIFNTFKNVFFGYYKEQNRRLLKLKIKSLNKRLTLKVKKIISQITSNN
jgi:phosphorylcholine metabolism protein LicD